MDDSSYVPGLLEGLNEKYVRTSDHHLPMGGSLTPPLPPPLLPPPLPPFTSYSAMSHRPSKVCLHLPLPINFQPPLLRLIMLQLRWPSFCPLNTPYLLSPEDFCSSWKALSRSWHGGFPLILRAWAQGHLLKEAFHKHHVKPLPVVYPQSQHPVFFIALTFWSGLIDLSPVSSHEWQRLRLRRISLLLTWHLKHYWVQKSGSKRHLKQLLIIIVYTTHMLVFIHVYSMYTQLLYVGFAGCVRQEQRWERDRENVNDSKEKQAPSHRHQLKPNFATWTVWL